jgi:hypothetical protein
MANLDTLTKSQKDAEEERKERELERNISSPNICRLRPQESFDQEYNETDDVLSHYDQDCQIPLERYLMYNNPRVKSFPIQKFVAGALSTGRVLNILPSHGEAHHCLSSDDRLPHSKRPFVGNIFQVPGVVTEERTKAWAEQIKDSVKSKKEERANSNRSSFTNIFNMQYNIPPHELQDGEAVNYTTTVEARLENIIKQVGMELCLNVAQMRCYNLFLNGLRYRA